MITWMPLALSAAILYALYNVFLKVASGHIHQIAGALVLQIVAALVGAVALITLYLKGQHFEVTRAGLGYSALAGIAVGVAEIVSFLLYSKGVSVSVGMPIIIGGCTAIATVIGVMILREEMSATSAFAIALIIIGVMILQGK